MACTNLEAAVPTAGIWILQMQLRELVYADDTCLLASSPEQLQALIDALAAYCATLQMEISVPKTKVMVVSAVPAPAVGFTCNGNPVEQVATFKYLGFISINQALLRILSHQSWRGLVVLGRLSSSTIHCCSVAILSTCICICCKLFWCLPYNMGVRSGVCIALALLLLTMLVLHYSACMITTSEPFAISYRPLLAAFY